MSTAGPSAIPIRNVYYLLCYAWRRLEQTGWADASTDGVTELVDLMAKTLVHGFHQVRRQALEHGYQAMDGELTTLRGRVDLLQTHRRLLDRHGRALCHFDELTKDTAQNRVLKAAASRLLKVSSLHKDHRMPLRGMLRDLSAVAQVPLSRDLLRQVHLHTNNRHYGFLMDLAWLIHECALPDEAAGDYRFVDFVRNPKHMARLFEDFIFNFMSIECRDLKVTREHVPWSACSLDDPALDYLPSMRTDVTVRRGRQTVVIDAKYYEETFSSYYDSKKLHGNHLYQLLAYVTNMRSSQGAEESVEGMLVYPTVSVSLDLRYTIQGHVMRVRTLDLMLPWREIEKTLRTLVLTPVGPTPSPSAQTL